jgi:hypothetical protein
MIQEFKDVGILEAPKPHALPVCFQLHLQRQAHSYRGWVRNLGIRLHSWPHPNRQVRH